MSSQTDPSAESTQYKLYACPACGRSIKIPCEDYYNFELPVAVCHRCPDQVELVEVDKSTNPEIMEYDDFVAMAMGFGSPQERIEPGALKYLLETRRILEVRVGGKKGRVDLHELKLDDGSIVHLNGAIAFKVTRE